MNTRVSWIAVVVAAIVYFVIGALWYSLLFGNAWMAGIGKTQAQIMAERPNPTMAFVITFFCNLILSSVLAQVIVATGRATAMHGIRVAFIAWAGFIATTIMMHYQFEVRSFTLWAINAGYPLVGMLVMGAILGGWTRKDAALAQRATA